MKLVLKINDHIGAHSTVHMVSTLISDCMQACLCTAVMRHLPFPDEKSTPAALIIDCRPAAWTNQQKRMAVASAGVTRGRRLSGRQRLILAPSRGRQALTGKTGMLGMRSGARAGRNPLTGMKGIMSGKETLNALLHTVQGYAFYTCMADMYCIHSCLCTGVP